VGVGGVCPHLAPSVVWDQYKEEQGTESNPDAKLGKFLIQWHRPK